MNEDEVVEITDELRNTIEYVLGMQISARSSTGDMEFLRETLERTKEKNRLLELENILLIYELEKASKE